jgi:hypothetical protein
MSKPRAALRAAGWVTVGVVAASGVGVATAATTGSNGNGAVTAAAATTATTSATTTAATPTATTPGTTGKAKLRKDRRHALATGLERRLLHGQATVLGKDGKSVQVAEQRGTVEAVSPTSI